MGILDRQLIIELLLLLLRSGWRFLGSLGTFINMTKIASKKLLFLTLELCCLFYYGVTFCLIPDLDACPLILGVLSFHFHCSSSNRIPAGHSMPPN